MPSTTSRLFVARRADPHPSCGAAAGVLRNGSIDQIKSRLEAANLIQNVTCCIIAGESRDAGSATPLGHAEMTTTGDKERSLRETGGSRDTLNC